jgi:hypothetical protein
LRGNSSDGRLRTAPFAYPPMMRPPVVGGVIVKPVFTPRSNELVAVNVPPPVNVSALMPSHVAVLAAALDIVAIKPIASDENKTGVPRVPFTDIGLVIIVVVPFLQFTAPGAVYENVVIVAPVAPNIAYTPTPVLAPIARVLYVQLAPKIMGCAVPVSSATNPKLIGHSSFSEISFIA